MTTSRGRIHAALFLSLLVAPWLAWCETAIRVVPNFASGIAENFAVSYMLAGDEPAAFAQAHLWITPGSVGPHTCHVMWSREGAYQHPGGIYLADDADNILAHPPAHPGSDTVLSNSSCSVHMKLASAAETKSAGLVLRLPVSFPASVTGNKQILADAYDLHNVQQGIRNIGVYAVIPQSTAPPATEPAPPYKPTVGGSGALHVGPQYHDGQLILDDGAIDIVTSVSPRYQAQGKWSGIQLFANGFVLQQRDGQTPPCTEQWRGRFWLYRNGTRDEVRVCLYDGAAYRWEILSHGSAH